MTDQSYYYDANRPSDRRKRSQNRRVFEVSEMSDLHHEITRRLLLGQKGVDIAEQLGCTPQTVYNVKNSRVVQDKLAVMRGARDANSVDVAKEIQRIAPVALENLRKVVEDGEIDGQEIPLGMKVKESNAILDRAGYGAKTQSEHRHLHAHLTPEQLEDIKSRARASGVKIIDEAPQEND